LYQGLRLSRRWLVVVIAAFCLPLLVGLGEPDLETDEAIYSFAVERILEIGDWLEPKSSPSETDVFLEKPPLKFWLVAAPIKAGLLPHDAVHYESHRIESDEPTDMFVAVVFRYLPPLRSSMPSATSVSRKSALLRGWRPM